MTAERFIPDVSGDHPGQRLHNTGDLARYRFDDSLEWVGRSDQQVKLRGFRIDLGEIEAVLRQQEETSEVVVVTRENMQGEHRVVAYVVLHRNQQVTIEELRTFVMQRLPTFFAPAAFVLLEVIPRLPNGKVDRRALPEPTFEQSTLGEREGEALNPIEQKMAEIWAEVLSLDRISIQSNFFELGGHSLLASQVIARTNDRFNVALSVRDLWIHTL